MAEARASRSVTGLFEHKIHMGADISQEPQMRSLAAGDVTRARSPAPHQHASHRGGGFGLQLL